MKANKVLASRFIDWYYSDSSEIRELGYATLNEFKTSGKINMSIEDIYDQCGYIPRWICLDSDGIISDEEYDPIDVELINDIDTNNHHPYDVIIDEINGLQKQLKEGNIDESRFVIEVIGLKKHLETLKLM
jgi:hypothetical protein